MVFKPKTSVQGTLNRYRAIFGSQRQMAKALGVSERWLSRVATGKITDIPPWMDLLIEFMERLPVKDWPEGVR